MELAQLEYFLKVVQEGSFSKAADRVFRTQPAVSIAIRRLEEEGRRLIVKSDNGADVRLRIASDTDIDGAATDRSELKLGMKLTATYQVPQGFNAALGYDVVEMIVSR